MQGRLVDRLRGLRTALSVFRRQLSLDGNLPGSLGQKYSSKLRQRHGREDGGLSVQLMWGRASRKNSWLQAVEPANVEWPAERSTKGFNDRHAAAAVMA